MVVIHKVRQNNTIKVKFIHKVSIVTTKGENENMATSSEMMVDPL